MRTVNELLQVAHSRGIELSPEGDHLHYRAPEGALDEDLKAELIQHKPEILAVLSAPAVVYFEDHLERWYKAGDGRFWHEDKRTGEKTELVPGNPPEGEPLPREFFEAFGALLGIVIQRRNQ
jgi:hypothetical protein